MTVPTEPRTFRRPAELAELASLPELQAQHGLSGAVEEPLEHDGWSGAGLTRLTRTDGTRFVLKRDSLARDWLARTLDDRWFREAQLVLTAPPMPSPVRLPHLGVARDADGVALLMPDLTGTLLPWEQPIDLSTLDRVLDALAALHRTPWHQPLGAAFPWTDLGRRLTLLTRRSAVTYEAEGNPVGGRFRQGWDAFDRRAPAVARRLIDRLTGEPTPVIDALTHLPVAGLHGDLKLGNVGLANDGTVPIIDWQMTLVAPVAVELGWFLVSNVAGLPLPPDDVLERYRVLAGLPDGDRWRTERDLAIVIGLFLRGWRKGLDAESGLTLPYGGTSNDDLAWWSGEAVAAAERRL